MIIPTKYMKTLLVILFSVGFTSLSFAQHGGAAGSFSRIGFGPRGMAMGNALTAVTNEGIYGYYNPALAAYAPEGNQLDLSTAAMSFDRSFNTANGTFQLPPTGGISLSIVNANVNNIDARSIDGYDTGTLATHDYMLETALAQRFGSLSVGIGLKYYIADYHTDLSSAKTLGLDIGLLYNISSKLKAGLTAQDLLASYNWNSSSLYGDDSSGRHDHFPRRIRLGISYYIISNLLVSIEVGHSIHENQSINNLRIGSAWKMHRLITLRAGWQIDELTSIRNNNHYSAGFSLRLPFDFLTPSIDYAFVEEPNNISYMHVFGLQLNL